jgi:hypothetical protein
LSDITQVMEKSSAIRVSIASASPSICRSGPPKKGDAINWTMWMAVSFLEHVSRGPSVRG